MQPILLVIKAAFVRQINVCISSHPCFTVSSNKQQCSLLLESWLSSADYALSCVSEAAIIGHNVQQTIHIMLVRARHEICC